MPSSEDQQAVKQVWLILLQILLGPVSIAAGFRGMPRGHWDIRLVGFGILGTYFWVAVIWQVMAYV